MALELKALEVQLTTLSAEERLQLARWLVDSVLRETRKPAATVRPLISVAGQFNGGPGDTAERAEEILEADIGPNGFGDIP
jgi:hypothetical protein